MQLITKVFRFEMAHALHGYNGNCKNIHGHSYELHVTIYSNLPEDAYVPAPGIIFDFKILKQIVKDTVILNFDHKLALSDAYLKENPGIPSGENLLRFDFEPSAENLLIYIRKAIVNKLPDNINLSSLKLYETRDSYAEWNALKK